MMDSGTVKIYTLSNSAAAGAMPVMALSSLTQEMDFEERTISQNRQYLAKGVKEQVDMVIRIWRDSTPIRIGMYAVLTNCKWQENPAGDQYRIDNVQPGLDDDGLDIVDLTLSRLEEFYEVNE